MSQTGHCCCSCNCQSEESNLMKKFPDKTQALATYMQSLPITDDSERNRGLLIQSLHKAQEIFGYLPESVQTYVATGLKLHLSEVYGVVSFYSYFTTVPQGQFKINICTGTACFVRGADKIVDEFKRYLNIELGESTEDMKYSLGSLRCVGACSLAPVVMVNEKVYGHVTTKMVADILADCHE